MHDRLLGCQSLNPWEVQGWEWCWLPDIKVVADLQWPLKFWYNDTGGIQWVNFALIYSWESWIRMLLVSQCAIVLFVLMSPFPNRNSAIALNSLIICHVITVWAASSSTTTPAFLSTSAFLSLYIGHCLWNNFLLLLDYSCHLTVS